MKNKKTRLWMRTVILAIFVAAVAFTLFQAFNHKAIAEGDPAPNFVLENLDGEKVKLSDFRGKGVLLNFWGTWCEPCKDEMPYLNAVYQQGMKGVVIIGVNIGQPHLTVSNFANRYDIKFPMLLDKSNAVTNRYNIGNIPSSILIDENGVIVDKMDYPMPTPTYIKKQLKRIQPDRFK
ncbi:MAG TPA: thiol-disulfide oxidoreductase ResA [Bacillales bacterium]